MRKAWLAVSVVLCATVVVTAIRAPSRLHRVDMASESDGYHQDDHVFLNFIPYSISNPNPHIRVSDDARRMLSEAGIRNIPEVFRIDPVRPPLRTIRKGQTRYWVSFNLKETQEKDAIDFYAKELVRPVRHSHTAETGVEGESPGGSLHVKFVADHFGGSPSAHLEFWKTAH